ncbi:exosortase family protein XrtF [Christiangramia forsetii]|uniref:Membrane protein n=2 Tax=Christiangramia forsetii TaxID=411153 RepID=A0M5K6_CHRFK|nr:exosortase family protein XrtF [Christiangramia forsetii]GGG32701.1 exosortase family protein XrtF [Christiangramia forsetii]CAL67901.1 membrane protein [Christiangramia forsetii KT0803]
MLSLIKKYRLVLRFIFIFLGSYFLFSSLYNSYLILYDNENPVPDPLTQLVARQSGTLMQGLGYADVEVVMHYTGLSMKLMVDDYFLAGIVEGCNSASIIILFASFVLAFFGKPVSTLLYLFAGSAIIYTINILRIVILSVSIYEYPQYSGLMHSIFFPLAIYGTVFMLWLIWVRIYSRWRKQ